MNRPAKGSGYFCLHVKRILPALIALSLLAAGVVRSSPQAQTVALAETPRELAITAGKSVLVESDAPVERVSVGLGDFAVATAISAHEILIDGKTPGETSLIVWQEGGKKLFFDVQVQASNFLSQSRLHAVEREIKAEMPDQNVDVTVDNDMVFLRGSVKDVTAADRAVAIASTLGKTVNLLYVEVPAAAPQILLKLKFASVDRSLSTQLGMNILSTGATNTIGSLTTKQFSPSAPPQLQTSNPSVSTTLADALNLFFFRPDLNLGATIQALQVQGLLQVLAEPNILAQNGKQASFLAGGEFPFPTVQSAGSSGTPTVSIQFREFGVRLSFIPEMTPRGTIDLRVAPEVSALDFTNGLSVSGFNVPALTTRKLNTEVELSDGQSFAIGGLLDNRTTDTLEKIPFIGEIPVLGKLFRSKSVSKQNTELIVIVTPEIVHPVPAGQAVPQLNFPVPFLQSNTADVPGSKGLVPAGPPPPPPAIMPLEVLMKSLLPPLPSALPGPMAPMPGR